MIEPLLILAATVLAGTLLVPLIGLLLYSPFGDLLVLIAQLHSPIGEVLMALIAVIMLPAGILGPPALWGLSDWALGRLFGRKV